MIELNEISKLFLTEEIETTALNKVNIRINKGEFVSIMGPSGCGKSTLLNILGLIDTPSSGEYHFNGSGVHGMSEKQRSVVRKNNISFIFQSFNLIDELSVFENVELPLIYTKVKASERKRRVEEVLEKMNMMHRKSHFPQQLSGGQQQRVAIARALVSKPALILADEPTGNLDSVNGEEVMEQLTKLNAEGTTIIMVTHSSRDASFSDRTIKLLDGKVISENQTISLHA